MSRNVGEEEKTIDFGIARNRAAMAYLDRVGAEADGPFKAVVIKEEEGGYPKNIATILFDKRNGSVKVNVANGQDRVRIRTEYTPSVDEALAIKEEWRNSSSVELIREKEIIDPPSRLAKRMKYEEHSEIKTYYEIYDIERNLIMVQLREDYENGKAYIPFTKWKTPEGREEWITTGTEEKNPIWGMERILYDEHGNRRLKPVERVMLHEGAKDAMYCRWLIEGESKEAQGARDAHPWMSTNKNETSDYKYLQQSMWLSDYVHLGWIGGATNPHMTDWEALKKSGVKEVIIVPDNDNVGRSAVRSISRELLLNCMELDLRGSFAGVTFPQSFGLADKFPEGFFRWKDGKRAYAGPSMFDCLQPATCATIIEEIKEIDIDEVAKEKLELEKEKIEKEKEGIKREKKRAGWKINPAFLNGWVWVEDKNRFVSTFDQRRQLDSDRFRRAIAQHIHDGIPINAVLDHIDREITKVAALNYDPSTDEIFTREDGQTTLNVYRPGSVVPIEGDISNFNELLVHMFDKEKERYLVKRFIYTLLARPGTKMRFGVLMQTQQQGVGKSALMMVLARIVGMHNASFPNVTNISGRWGSYLINKRLVLINEIWDGHSFKIYNILKPMIGDEFITVETKGVDEKSVKNTAHFIMASNEARALKLEPNDRRIFIPSMRGDKLEGEFKERFFHWLENENGYGVILNDAIHHFNDYFENGEEAPITDRKLELQEDSKSDTMKFLTEFLEVAGKGGRRHEIFAVDSRTVNEAIIKYYTVEGQKYRHFPETGNFREVFRRGGMHPFRYPTNVGEYVRGGEEEVTDWRDRIKIGGRNGQNVYLYLTEGAKKELDKMMGDGVPFTEVTKTLREKWLMNEAEIMNVVESGVVIGVVGGRVDRDDKRDGEEVVM